MQAVIAPVAVTRPLRAAVPATEARRLVVATGPPRRWAYSRTKGRGTAEAAAGHATPGVAVTLSAR